MQYRASSYPSWSRSFWVASLVVALAAAFFVAAWTPSAHAQVRADRPDFRITKASFDGRNLHVEYVNATGVWYPARRYEVGFQWYDASGAPVGTRHWLPVPGVERVGVAIFDTKYRTDLTYRRSDGRQYNRTLPDFIVQRPNTAEELRITVDDGDRISEMDETNNIARLRIPLPNLQITGAKFLSPNRLELSYRNANPSPIQLPFRIGFTWAEEGGAYASATRWINVLEPAAGATETVVLSRMDASYLTPQGRQAGDRLDWYFERRPGNATRMKITIDDAGEVREVNEHDNVVTARPFLPDLVVRDAKLADGQLTFTYGNDGEGPIRDTVSRVLIQWVNATGKPIGGARWIGFAQMDAKQTFAVNADRFDVEYAISGTNRTTRQRLSTYLREQPQGAERLDITIDGEQRIIEADERNNSVTVSPPPPPQPDFTITDAALTADALGFTVRNLGSGASPLGQPTSLWFEWVDTSGARVGALAWVDARSAIAPGQVLRFTGAYARFTRERTGGGTESVTLAEFLADVPATATHLKVHADGSNAIRESNETNNIALLALPAPPPPPLPDLTFARTALIPDAPDPRIDYVLKNAGTSDTTGAVLELQWLAADGKPTGPANAFVTVDLLRPGDKTTRGLLMQDSGPKPGQIGRFLLLPPDDATQLRLTLDPEGAIAESDETNNVTILARPSAIPLSDLTVTAAKLTLDAFALTYQNVGSVRAGLGSPLSTWFEWVDASGSRVGEFVWHDGQTLPPKYRTQIEVETRVASASRSGFPLREFLIAPPDGATHLKVSMDGPNTLLESNEGNNVTLLARPVMPLPDLAFTDVFLVPPKYERLVIGFQNAGKAAAPEFAWRMTWVDKDGEPLGEPYRGVVPALKPNWRFGVGSDLNEVDKEGKPMSRGKWLRQPKPEGAVTLEIVIDPENAIAESNEKNNRRTFDGWKPPEPAIANKPPVADAGDDILARDDDGNGVTTVRFYGNRSKDPDGKIASWHWTLDGKEIAKGEFPYWEAPVGKRTVTLTVTDDKGLSATDTAVVTVEEKPTSPPDLIVAAITLDPEQPKPNDLVTFAAETTNRGKAAVGQVSVTSLEVDRGNDGRVDEEKARITVKDLAPGASTTARWDDTRNGYYHWKATEGTHRIIACADRFGAVHEADERNNCAERIVTVGGGEPGKGEKPDLVLRDAKLADGKLRVTIVNVGKATAERVMWQLVWRGEKGEALATSNLEAAVGTLKPDASYPAEFAYASARPVGIFRFLQDMPDDAAVLEITVDPKNAIAESDEGNNTARIELSGTDLAFGVPVVREDALVIPVVNHGNVASVATDLWLQWYGKGKWLPGSGAVDVPAVSGGATVELKVPLNRTFSPDGKLLTDIPQTAERLRLFVDGLRKVPESNENNNLLMVDRAVFPRVSEPEKEKPGKPDLVPEGLKVGPASPTEGAMLDFSAVVRNKGTGKAGASVAWFIVDFDRDDEPDVSPEPDDVKALAPNATQAVVWEDAVEAQAGTHAVEFCVDVEEAVDESNEDNNCVTRTFTVGSGAAAPSRARVVTSPFRSILGAILSGLATPIVAGEGP